MVARFVMKSNKKRIIVVLAILTMAILLSCVFVACTKADTGDRGTNGTNGQDGIDGKSAYQIWLDNGNTGTEADFLTWLKGKDGTNGLNGKDGANGKDGKDGANGTNGQDGIDGKSAYQIWLDNGNTGTEADFLTWLKGKDGANGKDGTGIQSATINNNGELIVTLDDGTIINAGQVVAPEKRLDENNQITFKTFEKTDKTIYGKVSNVTETFYFTDEIELKGGAGYSVYTDFDCSNEIISKVVKLNVGDNTFYILEKCGNDSKFYTVTIRRREIYTVSFAVNDGTPLENSTIKVEEDSLVPKDSVPSSPRDGYDLVWDNDFTSPITENTVITATLTAIYSVSGNKITGLTDYGKSLTVLNIPSVIDGNGVTSIGVDAFSGCTGLTSITIPDSVTSIGSSAFRGCKGLTSISGSATNVSTVAKQAKPTSFTVNITSGTSIDGSAFLDCTGLTNITIPDSVTSIGASAFRGCTGLSSITIPDSVTSIGDMAFSDCSGLMSITIPDSVTSIGDTTFSSCTGLTSVTIGKGVTSIGDGAFGGCKALTSVTIPDSVTSIGTSAFSGCKGLTSVTIGNGVISIGEFSFQSCTRLSSVTIGNSVTSIGNWAFDGCSGLTSITIPNSVTIIGDCAFRVCHDLTTVFYAGTEEQWNAIAFGQNIGITSSILYYYSETEPALNSDGTGYAGNYWHYDTDGTTAVIWIYKIDEE